MPAFLKLRPSTYVYLLLAVVASAPAWIVRYPPLKWLAIYWLPFPRNVMTAPELRSRKPRDWSIEMETVRQRLEGFDLIARRNEWPHHPAFGRMTKRAWCVFAYRHMDHHFRQFGI